VIDAAAGGGLESLAVRHQHGGERRDVPAPALFVLIGAEPRTGWLAGPIALDDGGYVLTAGPAPRGRVAGLAAAAPPLLLETSIPGVFAAGDVRHRSIKRVAAAGGEGASAVQLVHEYLDEDAAP